MMIKKLDVQQKLTFKRSNVLSFNYKILKYEIQALKN